MRVIAEELESILIDGRGTRGRDAVVNSGIHSRVDQATTAEELNDLVAAIGKLHEKFAALGDSSRPVTFRIYVEGSTRSLDPVVCDQTYRIAAEALQNAFKHSQAPQVEVELRFGPRAFRLRVRDNGTGINGSVLTQDGRQGGYGLCAMRERAELVRGKLTVWSAPGAGTEVELTIPARRAYVTADATKDASSRDGAVFNLE